MATLTWFVCLLLLFSIHGCMHASATEEDDHHHEDERVYCSGSVIPGIERMSRGIDITELDLTPSDLHSPNGYRATLIDFTCKDGRVWTNPAADATEYKRPDQIAGVNTLPAAQLRATTVLSRDSEDYKRTQSGKVGLDIGIMMFAFSASGGLKIVHENMYRKNRSVAETSAMASAIQVDFKSRPHLKLTYEFTEFIPTAPVPAYEDSPELYDSFVRNFGTHYFARALFGGYLYQKTAINEGYILSNEEREITGNLEASFFGKVKATAEGADSRKNVSDGFAANTQTEFFYYGGTPVAMDPANPSAWMEKWLPTVNKDPWLFSGVLKPIEELIANQQVKGEVKKAITLKMARAYLEELKYIVQIGRFNLSEKKRRTMEEAERKLNSRDRKDIQEMLKQLEDIFATVQVLRDHARILQFIKIWDAKVPDIIACKMFIRDSCARTLRKISNQEYWEERKFIINLANCLVPNLDHEEAKRVLSEGNRLIAHYQSPSTLCIPSELPKGHDCKSCSAVAAHVAYTNSVNPACQTEDAWRVIGFRPK